MRANWSFRRGSIGLIAICLLVLASASVEQHAVGLERAVSLRPDPGVRQRHPRIDRWPTQRGTGRSTRGTTTGTGTRACLPADPVYWVSRHLVIHNDSYGQLHLMVLVGCGLPFLILMLLAWREVEARYPGTGPITAIMLGLGTILFPFSTTLFRTCSRDAGVRRLFAAAPRASSRTHRGPARWALLGAAGLLCGYSISTEYRSGCWWWVWPCSRSGAASRCAPPCGSGPDSSSGSAPAGLRLVGIRVALPALLHVRGRQRQWGARLGLPKLASAVKLLASDRGLFVVTPVMAAGVGGIVVLYREGRRLDALATTLVAAAYFIYNSGYYPVRRPVPDPGS